MEKAVELSGGSPVYLASLAHAYGVTGRATIPRRRLNVWRLAGQRYVASYDMAIARLGSDGGDRTLAALETAYKDRSPRLLFLAVDPRFDRLRSDARFLGLIKRVGTIKQNR